MNVSVANLLQGNGPMAPARILIVGINYAPEETGNAPYTSALAAHLAATGYHVTALTGIPHYPSWRVPSAYRSCLWRREQHQGVDVRRRWHYVPRRQSAIHRALFEASFALTGLSALALPRPDLVIGIVPSLSDGVLARIAARRFRVPYGLIFQDLMGQAALQSGVSGGRNVARATRALEGWIVRGATLVGIVSDGFREYLEDLGVRHERTRTLPNWSHIPPPTRPRLAVREALGWGADDHVVLHAGNMGVKQGLEHVITAARLALTSFPAARFVFMGNGNQRPMLEALARGLPNVIFLDPQPAERFPDVLAAADVLLVNERRTVVNMALPSKLTSYFVAGRPIVAATPPGSVTAREVERAGAAVVIPPEDPQALVDAVAHLAADRATAERLAAAGPAYAAAYLSCEAGLARVERFVADLLTSGAALASSGAGSGATERPGGLFP